MLLAKNLFETTTERLAIRPVALSDAYPLFQSSLNPSFNKNLSWAAPESVQIVLERIEQIMKKHESEEFIAVSAVEKYTGEWAGLFRLIPHHEGLEMSLWLHPKYWHNGYARELTVKAIEVIFSVTDVMTVVACAKGENIPACKTLETCGMYNAGLEDRLAEDGELLVLQQYRINR